MSDTPKSMQAAYVERLGPVSEIRIGGLPVPAPRAGEVLVQVAAVAVNAVDTFVRSGSYATEVPFPFVVGRDLAGRVAALGGDVDGFRIGDRVWTNSLGHAGRQGATAGYAVVPVDRLYRIPDGVDEVPLVATVHAAATAFLALHTHARVRPGETALVAGAAGNVGRAAVQIAREAGARVIATASASDLDDVRRLGADVALDYRDPAHATLLREALPHGADMQLDTSGHHDLDLAVDLLAPRGRIVVMAGLRARPELPVGGLYTRDGSILGFAISSATVAELADAAELINRMLADGTLTPPRTEEAPLTAARGAHARLEAGALHGVKLVLRPAQAPPG